MSWPHLMVGHPPAGGDHRQVAAVSRLARVGDAAGDSAAWALAAFASFVVMTQLLTHIHALSAADDLLGGMWAVIATLFVYRTTYDESVAAALSRVAATSVSFALCLLYLLFLPFEAWGLALLVAVGALVMMLIGRPQDVVTTGITTTVVLVVAGITPHDAWQQPILRLADTAAGTCVGLAAAWLGCRLLRSD